MFAGIFLSIGTLEQCPMRDRTSQITSNLTGFFSRLLLVNSKENILLLALRKKSPTTMDEIEV